jgi:nucleotide-binding universal stress UspA family protein
MRIVVPLDGSALAEQALEPAALLAKHLQPPADILLIRVVHYPAADAGLMAPYPGLSSASLIDDVLEAARDYLQGAMQLPILHGVPLQAKAEMGMTAQSICDIAHQEHADLIIMTSHGRTGFGKFVLGSVAEAVARDARIPVLIVRPQGETFPDIGRFTPLTILVPLDGTALSEAAITPAATLASAFHGSIYLLRVLPNAAATDDLGKEAFAYLSTFHDRLTQQGVTAHRTLAWGDPATQIVAKAQEHHVDVVAIATHARTPLAQLVQGSVAATVLHQSTLPMLLVHPADETQATLAAKEPTTAVN